jgi:hypothetical protein
MYFLGTVAVYLLAVFHATGTWFLCAYIHDALHKWTQIFVAVERSKLWHKHPTVAVKLRYVQKTVNFNSRLVMGLSLLSCAVITSWTSSPPASLQVVVQAGARQYFAVLERP